MSKIVDKIKAIPTNEHHVSNWFDIKTTFAVDDSDPHHPTSADRRIDVVRRYDIEVKLGASVLISQHEFAHIRHFVDKAKRAVIEELYGEFRKPLLDLEFTIAGGSQQEALEKVSKVYRDMFGMGE
jgi:hypothetical protein